MLQAAAAKIGHTLESLTVILSTLLVTFIASWKLTLVVLAFMPLIIGMGMAYGKMAFGFSRKDSAAIEQAGQVR